jgi:hypothetical protein
LNDLHTKIRQHIKKKMSNMHFKANRCTQINKVLNKEIRFGLIFLIGSSCKPLKSDFNISWKTVLVRLLCFIFFIIIMIFVVVVVFVVVVIIT